MEKTTSNSAKSKCGWRGKILQVDLTHSKIWDEELSDDLIRGYIGGAGINARLLAEDECPAITELLTKTAGS